MSQTIITSFVSSGQTLSAILLAFILSVCALPAPAQPVAGITFSHLDWELACDNTGTCRAAGYHNDDDNESNLNISVLLTRHAGPGEPVTGELQIGEVMIDNGRYDSFRDPEPLTLTLWVGSQSHGRIVEQTQGRTLLSAAQVEAILKAAQTSKPIVFRDEHGNMGILSNQGMSAVFLKMDDFQKRIGTPGALIRKGHAPETGVLKPVSIPSLTLVQPPESGDNVEALKQFYLDQKSQLIALTATQYEQECSLEDNYTASELDIYPLNAGQALLSRLCWRSAYNEGYTFWLINKELNSAQLVTDAGNSYEKGVIEVWQKGRGMGDCIYRQNFSWNGYAFVLTSDFATGMCKGAPGGFWVLPTVVYNVTGTENTP